MAEVQRPWTITLVEVLAMISGLLSVAAGIFVIIERNNVELVYKTQLTPDQLLWTGIFSIVVGAIWVLLASALGRGSEGVRIFFAIIASLNLASGVYGTFAYHGEAQASAALTAVLAAIVLWLLFGQQSAVFFDSIDKQK